MIFLRFSIPIMSIANSYMYDNYVKENYNIQKTKTYIEQSAKEINAITNTTVEDKQVLQEKDETNFLDKIVYGAKNIFSTEYYKNKIDQYQKATEKTGDYILQLIIAFVFQTIFFPILFLFFLYQLLRSIFNIGK
jgi:hypothetical protein